VKIKNHKNEKLDSSQQITLEHTLKTLKALWYIYHNLNMFVSQGLNFLLQNDSYKDIPSDDYMIM